MFYKKVLFALCITALFSISSVYSICGEGAFQTVYSGGLSKNVSDWSWSATRKFDCDTPVFHKGKKSMSYVSKNNEGLYLALSTGFSPLEVSQITFMIHGGGVGNQKIYIKLTSSKVAVAQEFYLYGEKSIITNSSRCIMANGWVQAVINTNNLPPKTYDGIQIITLGNEDQGRVYFDDIIIHKRCEKERYRNYCAPVACLTKDCVQFIVKEDKSSAWKDQSGVELQQYTVSIKNMNKKSIAAVEFSPVYVPKSDKDIWGVDRVENGKYTIPAYINALEPGKTYSFGCVAKKGNVEFKVDYVEFNK